MAWTNTPKPTGTPYTQVDFQGKQRYDESTITYDSATVYYDTINRSAWSNIAKPIGNFITTVGMATGLLTPPTYSVSQISNDLWTKVNKPT